MAQVEVKAEIAGNVWKIEANVGDEVTEDDMIVILESMKMEIPITAPTGGKIVEMLVAEGDVVAEGQLVAVLQA